MRKFTVPFFQSFPQGYEFPHPWHPDHLGKGAETHTLSETDHFVFELFMFIFSFFRVFPKSMSFRTFDILITWARGRKLTAPVKRITYLYFPWADRKFEKTNLETACRNLVTLDQIDSPIRSLLRLAHTRSAKQRSAPWLLVYLAKTPFH